MSVRHVDVATWMSPRHVLMSLRAADMSTRMWLQKALRQASGNEVLQHGACLGLGLTALGSGDEELLEELKTEVLYADNAVAGEACGIAMGLIQMGTTGTTGGGIHIGSTPPPTTTTTSSVAHAHAGAGNPGTGILNERTSEMLAYMQDTQHEKIVRGLGMGLALTAYGSCEAADVLIGQMVRDQDPVVRYAGMQTIGMAYAGTHHPKATSLLLHHAVTDVSADVKRVAVLSLGFVLMGSTTTSTTTARTTTTSTTGTGAGAGTTTTSTPGSSSTTGWEREDPTSSSSLSSSLSRCPQVVSLLAESYHPHTRYGAAMALGIAGAGSGSVETLGRLEPLLKDGTDFVRQGASIATALVLMQQPEEKRVTEFRARLAASVANR